MLPLSFLLYIDIAFIIYLFQEAISVAVDVTETADVEDDIKNIGDRSEEDSDCDQEGDNTDVKMESEEKKG